jgi:hypothetical protein
MRSLALIAFGSFIASVSLTGQTLAEHGAAAAGATVGTAAGKPLGTALGNVFGNVDKSTSKATGTTPVKPAVVKPELKTEEKPVSRPASAPAIAGPSGGESGASGSKTASASGHRPARRRVVPDTAENDPLAPVPPPVTVVVAAPVVKVLTVEEVAAVKVGASFNELQATLGPPESHVSIPDDDGHLLEICQYWSNGQALGTVRLDNGRVVSVQTRSY